MIFYALYVYMYTCQLKIEAACWFLIVCLYAHVHANSTVNSTVSNAVNMHETQALYNYI